MRTGGKKSFKKQLSDMKKQSIELIDLLIARIVSPRLNISQEEAIGLGNKIHAGFQKINNLEDLYAQSNAFASIRFGELFNIPVSLADLKKNQESVYTLADFGIRASKNSAVPYGIIAILGGPDAGKSSLINHMHEHCECAFISAMEPIQQDNEPFLIGPAASALGMVNSLRLKEEIIFFDSGRFMRGISDYGLGEKGLPIGVSLFLTDLNNLAVFCRKRLFLVISTESNRDDYNEAYYHLIRGAVNGVIQPITGRQAGLSEFKPDNRIPQTYEYGESAEFEALPNLFKAKQQLFIGAEDE